MNFKQKIQRIKNAFLYKVGTHFPYNKIRVWSLRHLGHQIGNDVYIHESITITQNFVDFNGKLTIGDRVSIAPNVTLVLLSHANYSKIRTHIKPKPQTIVIENDAWIGAGSIILNSITIGEGAIVGAGSVVTKDVAPYTTVAGNPAQKIAEIRTEEK